MLFISDKKTSPKKHLASLLLLSFLLLVLAPTGFAQDKTGTTEDQAEPQQVPFEQRIAELEAKLQSVKEQIDKAKQPEAGKVWMQYGVSADELQKQPGGHGLGVQEEAEEQRDGQAQVEEAGRQGQHQPHVGLHDREEADHRPQRQAEGDGVR